MFKKRFSRIIKRAADFLISLLALIILSPVFLMVAILIKLDSDGPIFFTQERVAKAGKIFKMYKFRTMKKNAFDTGIEDVGQDDQRITKIGRFLREWTIDELPQLMHILSGDMSLVGPRALPQHNIKDKRIIKLWQKRLSVRQGFISLVDIKGRNLVPWEERFEYDAWYVDNWSLRLDFRILVAGIFMLFSKKGIYGDVKSNKLLK